MNASLCPECEMIITDCECERDDEAECLETYMKELYE